MNKIKLCLLQQQLIGVALLEIKTENGISNEINSRQLMDVFALKKSHSSLRLFSFYKEGDSNYCLNAASLQWGLCRSWLILPLHYQRDKTVRKEMLNDVRSVAMTVTEGGRFGRSSKVTLDSPVLLLDPPLCDPTLQQYKPLPLSEMAADGACRGPNRVNLDLRQQYCWCKPTLI